MSNESEEFIAVANVSSFPDDGKLSVEVGDYYVVIVRVGDQFYCIEDICTHDGGPLGEGELNDFCLICPRHAAEFDVRTGEALTMPATEPTRAFEVKVENDQIFVRVDR